MSFKKSHIESLIIRALTEVDAALVSQAAVNLLLGTMAQESKFGRYLRQIGGPAIGVFQMEPSTFVYLRGRYEKQYPAIAGRTAEDLEWDLKLAIVMARLKYRSIDAPLPDPNNVADLAAYWNLWYNGNPNKGTDQEFIENYKYYVAA